MALKKCSDSKKSASAVKSAKVKPEMDPAPSALLLSLGKPGMSPLHRAGLGGLAATLQCLDKIKENTDEEEPNFPFNSPLWKNEISWKIDKTSIEFNFGKPENAKDFLEWLFMFAFQIQNEMIFLPGLYGFNGKTIKSINLEVRARLQQGIALTFLQHGQTRKLGTDQTKSFEVDQKKISYDYKECLSYTHQSAWKEWINEKGELVLKNYSVQGSIHPGAIVRHKAYTKATSIFQPLDLVLPLLFALVGTLSLPVSKGVGILLIPHVDDLVVFSQKWHSICPVTYQETIVTGLGDASLRFELWQRGKSLEKRVKLPGCEAVRFQLMPWSPQQKSRCETLILKHIDPDVLKLYDRVLSYLPPRVIEKKSSKKDGKGKNAVVTEFIEYFWTDSVVRSFIANNLARGNYWFTGFTQIMTAADPVLKKPLRDKISFEKEGLNKMINDEKTDWKLEGARSLVFAVQESLNRLYGEIANSAKGISSEGLKNRWNGEYTKWRIAFSGSKTQEQFRFALTDMFSRAKSVPSLQENWQTIMTLVIQDWQLARDLALVGLAGYKGKENEETQNQSEK